MRSLPVVALLAALPVAAAQVDDVTAMAMVQPLEVIGAPDTSSAFASALLRPVDAFYGFWTNGSPHLLAEAVSPQFVDHTLPAGRPQGPIGPAAASQAFLAAVPDLRVTVVKRLVIADHVVSHLRFTGQFTGVFQGAQGQGQTVDFIATDIVRVQGGRITDNWHLEDNLTFLKQIGMIPNF